MENVEGMFHCLKGYVSTVNNASLQHCVVDTACRIEHQTYLEIKVTELKGHDRRHNCYYYSKSGCS